MSYDPKSPLTQILQTKRWPPAYNPQNLPRYDGNVNAWQFIMSYEAAVTAAGGDEATMAKCFIIVTHDIAQSWYNNLHPGSIESWGDLRKKLCTNFKGISIAPNHTMDLFSCKQGEREPLQEY
jgi:hypothetical protein